MEGGTVPSSSKPAAVADGDSLGRLEAWYHAQCDGEWEHEYGVTVETLDNPGWKLRIDLAGTELAGREFARREDHRSENDWLVCWVEGRQFQAACGPRNLRESLQTFLSWAR